jgi:hypothetical protein
MYATIVADHELGDLSLATSDGAVIVGTRAEMDAQPGTTVIVPDDMTPVVQVAELAVAIPATPWDR